MPPGPVPMRTTLQTQEDRAVPRESSCPMVFPSIPVTGILESPKMEENSLINNTNTTRSNYNIKNPNIGPRALTALAEDLGSVPSAHSSSQRL